MNVDFLIPIVIFGSIVYLFKSLSDNRLRHKLIERGQLDESVKYLFMNGDQHRRFTSLKWGIVLIAIGCAFLIGQAFGQDLAETITVGSIFLFGGIGFLVYYFLVKNMTGETGE